MEGGWALHARRGRAAGGPSETRNRSRARRRRGTRCASAVSVEEVEEEIGQAAAAVYGAWRVESARISEAIKAKCGRILREDQHTTQIGTRKVLLREDARLASANWQCSALVQPGFTPS